MPTPLYALLIGVNTYKADFIPPLKGCQNDIALMASVLRPRFEIPENHLRILVDEQATHAAIKQAFREHLIEQAQRAQSSGEPAPAFLFHFSGHGSKSIDTQGTKLAGVDETLVPHDSRQSGILDLKDWELGALLDELAQYSQNITVWLDCCHSGSGTRDIDVATRQCPPDYRPQPERPAVPTPAVIATGTRSTRDEAVKPLRHVLLAACSNAESAKEWKVQTSDGEQHYGAFTYALAEELAKTPTENSTYRELHQRVFRRLVQRNVSQSPQCEGERDRLLFGGNRPPRDSWICVTGQERDLIKIDAGGVHGLAVGNELNVYAEGTSDTTRQFSAQTTPLARLKIVERGAVSSLCQVIEGNAELAPGCCVRPMTFGSQLTRTVSLAQASPQTRAALEQRLSQPDLRGIVRTTSDSMADLCVQSCAEGDGIFDATGQPLETPTWTTNLDALTRSIQKWAKHFNALRIENPSPQSSLRGQVTVEIKLANGASITGAGQVLEAGESPVDMEIVLTNGSTDPLYLNALAFGYDGSIALVWPLDGERIPVPAGKSKTIRDLQLSFPGSRARTQVREAIKVFATRSPTDFDLLTMNADGRFEADGTRSACDAPPIGPLGQLLEQAALGTGTRLIQPKAAKTEEDWTTAELVYQLVRPKQEREQPLTGGQNVTLPGSGCVISAPAGFMGTMRAVTTVSVMPVPAGLDAVRSGNGPSTAAVPSVDPFAQLTSRLSGQGHVVESFEIDADNRARAQISSASPLRIQWGPGQRSLESTRCERVLAIAADGELLYPVGLSQPGDETVDVTWLPPSGGASPESLGTRSVAGSVRLYFYKLLNWESGTLGLHRVRWVPWEQAQTHPIEPGERTQRFATGEVRKRRVNPGEVLATHKVLVLVHGGLGDAETMLAEVGPLIMRSGQTYDHILAFAYETFTPPLQESATQLARALASLGLAPTAGGRVDLMAAGVGSLVARAAVEMLGAHTQVSRCLLAGPPNTGTLLAKSQSFACWLGTLDLLKSVLVPQLMPLSIAFNKVVKDAAVIRDLQPQSDFLKALNAASPPVQIPYTVLAGIAELPPALVGFVRRLADSTLSLLFDDEHDMVCSQTSMHTLRNGKFPLEQLKIHIVPADHFSYWSEATSCDRVVEWLRA